MSPNKTKAWVIGVGAERGLGAAVAWCCTAKVTTWLVPGAGWPGPPMSSTFVPSGGCF